MLVLIMSKLDGLSHLYKGLIIRNRAFASFKIDELDAIYNDIVLSNIDDHTRILDPMSGYGGGMLYFATKGFSTFNVELNPPSYYWQLLINPKNRNLTVDALRKLKERRDLPEINVRYSITDELFSVEAVAHIKRLFEFVFSLIKNKELAISLLLPFVARFANYQKNDTNFTHFKQGGLCSFAGWEADFFEYLDELESCILKTTFLNDDHVNVLSDISDVDLNLKFRCFVTSPPYPNYRDYSKIFKIENWVLNNILEGQNTDFDKMIGSDVIKGKEYGIISSEIANRFLTDLLDKSQKLTKKSRRDIEVYYHPYFALYFYNLQEAYKKVDSMMDENAVGYVVVNNNITRDIEVPVGKSICDFFNNMGYGFSVIGESEISHLGNIRKKAKRINSRHVRQIVKVWKK